MHLKLRQQRNRHYAFSSLHLLPPQTLGIATALKVLFSDSDCDSQLVPPSQQDRLASLHLERNEVIALVNLLARFSSSLETYHTLSAALKQQQGVQPSVSGPEAVA